MRNRTLRSGFTTGACAAAAAKAATTILLEDDGSFYIQCNEDKSPKIEIPFPDGSRHGFKIKEIRRFNGVATASVIKDAGDDPDVTNGAEIIAEAKTSTAGNTITIKGGRGVGIVTKPGLAIKLGEPAINPVPRMMITEAVSEAISALRDNLKKEERPGLDITISITSGEELALKTLNHRLGIVGGLSVLGTTGIVKPLSADAWTATIVSSMDVARATGRDEIVLSTGRTSECAHTAHFAMPEECYVMMGDYLHFSLKEAVRHKFRAIHLCAQWAKMLKFALGTGQTHVRYGAIETAKAVNFLCRLLNDKLAIQRLKEHPFNTAREAYDTISELTLSTREEVYQALLKAVSAELKKIVKETALFIHLASYENNIIASYEDI